MVGFIKSSQQPTSANNGKNRWWWKRGTTWWWKHGFLMDMLATFCIIIYYYWTKMVEKNLNVCSGHSNTMIGEQSYATVTMQRPKNEDVWQRDNRNTKLCRITRKEERQCKEGSAVSFAENPKVLCNNSSLGFK